MSIFSKIVSGVKSLGKSVLSVAKPILGGAVGSVVGGAIGGPAGAVIGSTVGGGAMSSIKLPPLPGVGGGGIGGVIAGTAIGAAGAAGRGITSAMRGAATMCRKYPQWCVAVGGATAVASMMQSGQLPMPKRRRRKGITPRDLQSFRRVASLIKSYGPTARRVPSSCAPRRTCKR